MKPTTQQKRLGMWAVLLVTIMTDQVSKWYATSHLFYQEPVRLLSWLNMNLTFNTGIAYGWLAHQGQWAQYLLSGLAVLVTAGLITWWYQQQQPSTAIPLFVGLIAGGAMGNVVDRLRYGSVVDFIQVHRGHWAFATFNVADSAISVGVSLLIIYFIFFAKKTTEQPHQ